MSVSATMEGVLTTVPIPREVIIVNVLQDIHFNLTSMIVLIVSTYIRM